jgi:hypothetical protein
MARLIRVRRTSVVPHETNVVELGMASSGDQADLERSA